MFLAVVMKNRVKELSELTGNLSKFKFIHDKIKNKIDFVDQPLNIRISGIFALKKNVQMYQWVENRTILDRRSRYVYNYRKEWNADFIDSTKFQDKTRSNHLGNMNVYKSKIIPIKDIITEGGFMIDKKYFEDEISYQKYEFRDPKIVYRGAKIKQNNKPSYVLEENYSDLDSYVAALDKKTVKAEFDEFRVVNKNTLYNGRNFSSPEIGDIRIDYDIAAPKEIFIFGKINRGNIIPHGDMVKIDPDVVYTRDKFILSHRIYFSIELIVSSALQLALFYLILENIRKNLRKDFLRIIPFPECYLDQGKTIGFILFLLTATILLKATILYYPALLAMLLAVCFLKFNSMRPVAKLNRLYTRH
ncbi:MAG: TMEM43 family protein [Rickettsiales bacterium]|nr:TMEM43 family protein [Rickettsiales bacterium]